MSSEEASKETGRIVLAVLSARDNIRLIRQWASNRDLEALKADRMVRYAIERAFILLDASIRDLPRDLLAANAIPANLIAGFRNALAHTYEDILDDRVILTIREDLPDLDGRLERLLQNLSIIDNR
jgi:uncharacterized protein with HEPN domain